MRMRRTGQRDVQQRRSLPQVAHFPQLVYLVRLLYRHTLCLVYSYRVRGRGEREKVHAEGVRRAVNPHSALAVAI